MTAAFRTAGRRRFFSRPLILPARHFVFPGQAEEVERGALEVLIRPTPVHLDKERAAALKGQELKQAGALNGHDFSRAESTAKATWALAPEGRSPQNSPVDPDPDSGPNTNPLPSQEFLATCALGFRDSVVPTGLWSTPNPDEICAVSGGYAYIIDTTAPERFAMIAYRPVLEIYPATTDGLLLFVGHHAIIAWGAQGQAWQSEKLSDEGVAITGIEDGVLHGRGWEMKTDKEHLFTLDLQSGLLIPPAR